MQKLENVKLFKFFWIKTIFMDNKFYNKNDFKF